MIRPEVRAAAERTTGRLQYLVLAATLLVIPQLLLEEAQVTGLARAASTAMDWFIWLVFLAELITTYVATGDARRWAREHRVDILIVVLTPPVSSTVLASIRLLRLLRLVRLLRVAPLVRGAFSLNSLLYAGLLAVLTMFAGGLAFSEVEPDITFGEGVYWALTTMSTVGYGDLTPSTDSGRIVAAAVMLVGIGFLATLTAAIADRLIVSGASTRSGRQDGIAERLDRIEQQLAALAAASPASPGGRFDRTHDGARGAEREGEASSARSP